METLSGSLSSGPLIFLKGKKKRNMNYYLDRNGYFVCKDLTNREIINRNFSGVNARAKTKYPGIDNKQFALVIRDNDAAQQLLDEGWPVSIRVPNVEYDPDEQPYYVMYVAVKFRDVAGRFFTDGRQPEIYLWSNGVKTPQDCKKDPEAAWDFCSVIPNDELMQSQMDKTNFSKVELKVRKYVNSKGTTKVYLSRFDGMLRIDDMDRDPEGWANPEE